MRSFVLSLSLLVPAVALAEPKAEMKAGTGIENRELTGAAETFKSTDTVYVWANVTDADGQKVHHSWKVDDKEVFQSAFDVKSKRWRVNSRRKAPQKGHYVVTTTLDDGTKLGEIAFTVE